MQNKTNGSRDFFYKNKRKIAIWIIAVFITLTLVITWFVGVPMIRFASKPESFRLWVHGHGVWGKLLYMGMVILQVIVAIIPGEPMEIAGGYAFGAIEGTILCLVAASIGSVLVFLLVRKYGVWLVQMFFSKEKLDSLHFLKSSAKRDFLFLIIFMIPGTPKDLLCYFAGLTDINFPSWLLICSLGRIPSIVTSTIGGDALGTKSYIAAVLVFLLTLLISGGGLLYYNSVLKKHEKTIETIHLEKVQAKQIKED